MKTLRNTTKTLVTMFFYDILKQVRGSSLFLVINTGSSVLGGLKAIAGALYLRHYFFSIFFGF